jgi:hypothetical protein
MLPAATPLSLLAAVIGAGGALLTWTSVVGTLLIPRGRVGPLMRTVDSVVVRIFRLCVRRTAGYLRRDAVLAAQAPVVLITQLAVWLVAFWASFTLLLRPDSANLRHAAREAVSSMLTLGFTTTTGGWSTTVDAVAAVTGLVVIALQIAYVPTLYSAYNRRETEVTLLRGRAGEPPWGPELLARTHYGILGVDLTTFYAAWERWAADIAESHASYPVLLRFRSPRPLASWLVALLAVLDAAAMQAAVAPAATPVQTRLTLRMGFLCLRQLARTAGIQVDDDPLPDAPLELTEQEFAAGYQRLVQVGYPVERSAEQAWPHFRGWRVNYEAAAYALAAELDAVPARWSGPRRSADQPIEPVRPPNRTPP